MTAGRRLLDSAPRAGSRSTIRTSPRCTSAQPVVRDRFPQFPVGTSRPVRPSVLIGGTELGGAQQPHRLMDRRTPRTDPLARRVLVEELDILVRQAHTHLHTLMLLR